MNRNLVNWVIFVSLCLIWGSSFILMKGGMRALSSIEVASVRIVSSGIILLPWTYRAFKNIPRRSILAVFFTGVFGNMLPAFLYCIAEEKVDSALAGSLNCLTPVFVIILGILFFKAAVSFRQITGVMMALAASVMLSLSQPGLTFQTHGSHLILIIFATLSYAININLIKSRFSNMDSLQMTSMALFLVSFPCLALLVFKGFFHHDFFAHQKAVSTLYAIVLGVMGTAVATIIFNILIQRSGVVFSSMVTYGIPVVANVWGLIFGEYVGWIQAVCLFVILSGVFLATRKPSGPHSSLREMVSDG